MSEVPSVFLEKRINHMPDDFVLKILKDALTSRIFLSDADTVLFVSRANKRQDQAIDVMHTPIE